MKYVQYSTPRYLPIKESIDILHPTYLPIKDSVDILAIIYLNDLEHTHHEPQPREPDTKDAQSPKITARS